VERPRRAECGIGTRRLNGLRLLVPAVAACVLLVAVTRFGCRSSSSREPLTVACLDPEWLPDSNRATGGGSGSLGQNRLISDADLLGFSEDPGIRVRHLPPPEATPDQFAFDRNLLLQAAATPDVYAIDILWASVGSSRNRPGQNLESPSDSRISV
jgi:hypothetical protein